MKNNKFSIIIPTYNRADRLIKTVQSVLNQSYDNFEIIIVDDGSTDNTEKIIGAVNDLRLKYFYKKNEERAIARNYGIQEASGDYITFLDSDDLLYPNHFEEANKLIEANNNPEWFHLAYEIKDEQGNVLRRENKRSGNINDSLKTGNHLSCIGIFIRKDIMKENLFYEDPDIIGSEDYELWLRLASKYPLHYSNEITSCMIQHSERSVVSTFNEEKLIARIEKIIELANKKRIFNPKQFSCFKSNRYMYLSLHLAMIGKKQASIKYLVKAFSINPKLLFSKKVLGIIKNHLP